MNNKCKFLIVLSLIFIMATLQVQAEKYKGPIVKSPSPKDNANCSPPSQNIELSLNLVRAYIMSNGTMWFREKAEYEVPKGTGKTSMFSAALWIGGQDKSGQLYVAAMTFGQRGNDYWTGPLNMKDGSIDQPTCNKYDRFFPMSRILVEQHIRGFAENDAKYMAEIPKSILEWPAMGEGGQSQFLAPFYTLPGNNPYEYRPDLGDYPYYDFDNELCPWTDVNIERAKEIPWLNIYDETDRLEGRIPNSKALPMPMERIVTRADTTIFPAKDNMMIFADHVLKGDETIFWFLNDRGGTHTESKSPGSIGLEIRVQAFAFATNDELNKMTFYSYEIINRGTSTLTETYFSQWVDPDLGYADDDFVGCDVMRGLGYCYNGKEIDGSGENWAYGANPPAVGVDFFQGPYIDPDGSDNPKFIKEAGNITGNPQEKEYCEKFVHLIHNYWRNGPPELLSDTIPGASIVVERIDTLGIKHMDTLPIRWNNQYAINGVNFGDGIIDNERFGMRRFVYHINGGNGPTSDPDNYTKYYNMLKGIWGDGKQMTYGGTGYNTEEKYVPCDFMFPRGTDFCNWGTKGEAPNARGATLYGLGGRNGNWSEENPEGADSKANTPGDRRFMQSAGPFTLEQGACNYITVGIPWARASSGGVQASIDLLIIADDKCQALFENCFKLLDGPDAPNLTIREYDQKLILLLTNSPLSNNANEDYAEKDQTIPAQRIDEIKVPVIVITDSGDTITFGGDTTIYKLAYDTIHYDQYYRFEGYQIYQVTDPGVGANDLENPSLSRLIRQYDIVNFDKNGNPIGRLINYEFDEDLQVSIPKEKVNGSNTGIEHSFEVTQDVFATGSKQLVNYKTYYFIAIAYAYNEYWPYSTDPLADNGLAGQKLPYLRGRKTAGGKSVTPIAAVPHPPSTHGGALTLNCEYGSMPYITRVDGQGNGGFALELTQETIDKIVTGGDRGDYRTQELKYERNAGPLNVKVIDPLRVRPFDYTVVIRDSIINENTMDVTDSFYWELIIDESVPDAELIAIGLVNTDSTAKRVFSSSTTIGNNNEYLILPLGISVTIKNADFVSNQPALLNSWSGKSHYVMETTSQNLHTAKLIYLQSEKIDISKDVVFSNNGSAWITGLADEGNYPLPSNWIRAGSFNLGVWDSKNGLTFSIKSSEEMLRKEDAFIPTRALVYDPEDRNGYNTDRAFKDPTGKFSTLCGGTWAPYVLTSPYDQCPQAKYVDPDPVVTFDKDGKPVIKDPDPFYTFWDLRSPTGMNQPGYNQTMTNLYSVDVVLTSNKDLWTRCVVLESCADPTKSEGGALKNEPRKAKSVGKDGKPDGKKDGFGPNQDEGMGWFPGYAISLETGERLNIMFSENSSSDFQPFNDLVKGRDMIFNPTSTYAIATKDIVYKDSADRIQFELKAGEVISQMEYNTLFYLFDNFTNLLSDLGIERVWGGMHYVYVCNSAGNTSPMYYATQYMPDGFLEDARRNFNLKDTVMEISMQKIGPYGGYIDDEKNYPYYECGPYDEGKWLVQKFNQYFKLTGSGQFGKNVKKNTKMQIFNNVMYTHIPMQPEGREMQDKWLSCDVTYKIRVTRPYLRYASRWYENPDERPYKDKLPDGLDYNGFPVYKMSTKLLAPTFNDPRVYQSILDNINIVPNPYYGASLYENNPLENLVKIINLPTDLKNKAPVTINIFTVNGILVRTITKGDSETSYVNWDLKNHAGIPIAGGVYIIHVNCPGIGERMLKFFCTMRPADLNTF